MAMDMDTFSIANGGLDVNLIGGLWEMAEGCDVIRPLAHTLLDDLIHDPYSVFRRLRKMRARLERLRKTGRAPRDPETNIAGQTPSTPETDEIA